MKKGKERRKTHLRSHRFTTGLKASGFASTIASVFFAFSGKTTVRNGKERFIEGIRGGKREENEGGQKEGDDEMKELIRKSELDLASNMKMKNMEETSHWAQGFPRLHTVCSLIQ